MKHKLPIDIKSDRQLLQKVQDRFNTKTPLKVTRQDFLTEEVWDEYQEWLYPIEELQTYTTK
jgi:hypothetical protein